jgi:hypothetical protein
VKDEERERGGVKNKEKFDAIGTERKNNRCVSFNASK